MSVSYTSETNKQTSKLIEKKIRFAVTRGGVWARGQLDIDGQKIQNFSYKINKY